MIDVPVDREGIDTASLDRYPDARAAYVTPAHQAPLGVTMSVSRRLELLDWAQRTRAWIIEDDYDGEFSYQTAPLPALKSLDACDRVIYCGSFNKTLFSGLRIGFMVVPAELRPALSAVWHATARSVGVAPQLALARFIGHGDFAAPARHAYRQRATSCSTSWRNTRAGGTRCPASTRAFISCCGCRPGWTTRRMSRAWKRTASGSRSADSVEAPGAKRASSSVFRADGRARGMAAGCSASCSRNPLTAPVMPRPRQPAAPACPTVPRAAKRAAAAADLREIHDTNDTIVNRNESGLKVRRN